MGRVPDSIELTFELALYPLEAIEAAVAAFDGFAQIELRVADGVGTVVLSGVSDAHLEVLPHELANYALFESAVRARGGGL